MAQSCAPSAYIKEAKARRQQVLAQMVDNSVMVIGAGSEAVRSQDTHYRFRQQSDFWYLTGFKEPDAVLVLVKLTAQQWARYQALDLAADTAVATATSPTSETQVEQANTFSMVFVRPTDPDAERWHGRRLGVADSAFELMINEAYDIAEFEQRLLPLLRQVNQLYFDLAANDPRHQSISKVARSAAQAGKKQPNTPLHWVDYRTILYPMRMIKSDTELDIMRHSASLAARGHTRAMQFAACNLQASAQLGQRLYEYHLEAEILHEFMWHGQMAEAYGSIVGSGENACILHYVENNSPLTDGDLVLIDAGVEVLGYASDITRTWPLNGQFSEAQRDIYDLVLASQIAAIEAVQPGVRFQQIMDACLQVLVPGLCQLGILSLGPDEQPQHRIDDLSYRAFFMHGLGHFIGLDVHDVGHYCEADGESVVLRPGMVITIEPGLYFAADAQVAEQYRGIGVRIEDDVLVTETGFEVLTDEAIKDPDLIEELMAYASQAD